MIIPKRKQCEWKRPESVATELVKTWGQDGFAWLDGDGTDLGRWVTLAINPIEQFCCRGLPDETDDKNPFEILEHLSQGYWIGWLSYEAGAWIEQSNLWKPDSMATLWIAKYDPILRFDLKKKYLWIEGCNPNTFKKLDNWLKSIPSNEESNTIVTNKSEGIPLINWKWHTSTEEYIIAVEQIKEWIANGDIFQANLTSCCSTRLPEQTKAIDLYKKLREFSPAPFSGLIIANGPAKGEAIISTSPERFLKVLPSGEIETRPIKGTRPRKNDLRLDYEMAAELICSIKDRAENVMIVDILRNDLGKVCKPGSISIPQIVGLESYPHVHHLTSIIKGQLQENKRWIDLMKACWPGGSISGAPKLRACQRLYELEPTARGPYCGALLHINWNGHFDSNILIRTLMMKDNKLRVNAGCGIVADSQPTQEAAELKWKLMPLLQALE